MVNSGNNTTPSPHDGRGYYALIPLVLALAGFAVVIVVMYFKRRSRSGELRHRLIPVYMYDPSEEDDLDLDFGSSENEEGLEEPLSRYGKLLIHNHYGTE